LTLEEFDNKEKYFENYDVFLNLRDKMIEDLYVLQTTAKVQVEKFVYECDIFFN
jgi:hypothetical protein